MRAKSQPKPVRDVPAPVGGIRPRRRLKAIGRREGLPPRMLAAGIQPARHKAGRTPTHS